MSTVDTNRVSASTTANGESPSPPFRLPQLKTTPGFVGFADLIVREADFAFREDFELDPAEIDANRERWITEWAAIATP